MGEKDKIHICRAEDVPMEMGGDPFPVFIDELVITHGESRIRIEDAGFYEEACCLSWDGPADDEERKLCIERAADLLWFTQGACLFNIPDTRLWLSIA